MEMDRADSSRSPEPTRRAFIAITAGGLLSAPLTVRAQPDGKVYRIGILGNVPVSDSGGARLWGAFTDALRQLGYVEGRNLRIEHLSSEGRYDRLPALAAELVRRQVDVIVAPAAQNVVAVRQASRTIPIVMVSVGDPEASGLVASLARPGGNVTGTSFITSVMVEKQLELLKQIAPRAERQALLLNPANPGHPIALEKAKATAQSLGVRLLVVEAGGSDDLERAFSDMTAQHAGALLVPWDGTFLLHAERITRLAARTRLPAMYGQRTYVDRGGLVCYGPSASESFHGAAAYVDKIFKGAKPGDLPVEQPTTFEFVINLKTARALGLTIQPALLQRADQVIE
jgi:putative ABC transport system substrate-binding protein